LGRRRDEGDARRAHRPHARVGGARHRAVTFLDAPLYAVASGAARRIAIAFDRSKMTHPEISLGLARRADVIAIAGMSRELIEQDLAWSWTPERVAASGRSRNALVVVARTAEQVAGFAIMRYGDDDAHLDLLGVDPEYRRAGLGRRLVEWLEKPALVAGIRAVFLEVREQNLGAQMFYARLGYRQLARLAQYYQGRESAVRMGRELGCRVDGVGEVCWPSTGDAAQALHRPPR
jgi:ribosomal-protein-alanine N-acetyltransferase